MAPPASRPVKQPRHGNSITGPNPHKNSLAMFGRCLVSCRYGVDWSAVRKGGHHMSSNEKPQTPASVGAVEPAPASDVPPTMAPGGAGMQPNATFCNTGAENCLTVKQLQALDMLLYGETDAAV